MRTRFTFLKAVAAIGAMTSSPALCQQISEPAQIGIGAGAGSPKSHLSFRNVPGDTIFVSTRLRVVSDSAKGLNYFAIQVNSANRTWAHGGLQLTGGRRQTNWGGLVNRGGGKADYKKEDPAADLLLMQNGADHERNIPSNGAKASTTS